MKSLSLAIIVALTAAIPAMAQEQAGSGEAPGEYRIFDGQGRPATLADIVAAMDDVDVVFVGETHDDPTGHWVENEILMRAFTAYGAGADAASDPRPVALSLEFFQRDVQQILDEYLAGLISERSFTSAARPWPHYDTDYRGLIEFSKTMGIPVIAANAPQRYTNRVSREGRESLMDLSAVALATLPPLPYGTPSPAYRNQWFQAMADAEEEMARPCGVEPEPDAAADSAAAMPAMDHAAMGNMLHVQALWDASMAFSIAEHLLRHPGALVIHMVGSFHVEHGTGTPEHLEHYRPGTRRIIVVIRAVEDVAVFDPESSDANEDFVILTDESLTRSELECRGG